MMYRSHAPLVLVLITLVCSLLACSLNGLNNTKKGQYGFTKEELAKQKDVKTTKSLAKAKADVERIPGPVQYKTYTMSLCDAYNDGLFERQPELKPDEPGVVALGERIASKAPYEAHNVTAFKGLYLLCTRDFKAGEEALIESINIKPGRDAGEVLAVLYGSSGEFELVGQTCAKVVPYLQPQDRFMMMETCKEQLHATTDEAAFFWATEDDMRFWNAEQSRRAEAARQRAIQEEKQRVAIVKQQREEWQRRREERRADQNRQNRSDACLAQCKQTAHMCNKDCYNDHCTFSCNKAYEGCQEECYIRAR